VKRVDTTTWSPWYDYGNDSNPNKNYIIIGVSILAIIVIGSICGYIYYRRKRNNKLAGILDNSEQNSSNNIELNNVARNVQVDNEIETSINTNNNEIVIE